MNDELAFPGTEDKTTVAEVDAYIKGENCDVLRKQKAQLLAALQLAREWFRHEDAGSGPSAKDVIAAADAAIAATGVEP